MSNDPSEQPWARLAKAARRNAPPQGPDELPDGEQIRARFQGMTETLRTLFLLSVWKRWALLAVILGLLAYAAAFYLFGGKQTPASDPPVISIPVPP